MSALLSLVQLWGRVCAGVAKGIRRSLDGHPTAYAARVPGSVGPVLSTQLNTRREQGKNPPPKVPVGLGVVIVLKERERKEREREIVHTFCLSIKMPRQECGQLPCRRSLRDILARRTKALLWRYGQWLGRRYTSRYLLRVIWAFLFCWSVYIKYIKAPAFYALHLKDYEKSNCKL